MIALTLSETFASRDPSVRAHAVLSLALLCSAIALAACESYAPGADESGLFETCCSGTGRCVPEAAVDAANARRLSQDSCRDALLCVPAGLAEDTASYRAETCRSFGTSEGRCLPSCLPAVAARASHLAQDDCPEYHACVPCFDPLTSASTGACELGGDPGPDEDPQPFAPCCEDRGRCVPRSIIEPDRRSQLSADGCSGPVPSLCVPRAMAEDPAAKPAACKAHGDIEGRCLSECLPEVRKRSASLRDDACRSGHKCVPCYDPVSGEDTGACRFSGDEPRDPAQLFEGCCGELGACVPRAAVAQEERARLAADSCSTPETLCAPRAWLAKDREPPPVCRAYGQLPGRCLPRCLPGVASRAERLQRDGCEPTHACVPCFDPVTGEDTGACTLAGDRAPEEPALFGECCAERGRCLPEAAVGMSFRSELDRDSCDAAGALCVPDPWLVDTLIPPKQCHPYGDYEGRCLPECLPAVEERAKHLKRASCRDGERCSPCFDPLTGAATGACELHGDHAGSARLFPSCCGQLGACVPPDALEPDDRKRLDASECSDALCAPKAWIADDRALPERCTTLGDVEGRCLPSCIPGVGMRADQLQRESCPDAHLCVPCYDPRTLESTRACNIGEDLPAQKPKPFDVCCGGLGWCVPEVVIPEADRARLGLDSCDGSRFQLCAPIDWAKSDRFIPVQCSAPGGLDGRCLPDCLPEVAQRRERLTASTCAAQHLCVPCFDPITGEDTHACSVGDDMPSTTGDTTYPACCGGAGACVPDELIDGDDRERLGRESCDASSGALCVPRSWAGQERTAPEACAAFEGAEGRCLSICLPSVASQLDELRRDRCAESERCVPCFDPLDGSDTRACRIATDSPTQPPYTFPTCCGELGRCVPGDRIAESDRGGVSRDSCSQPEHACVPSDWLGANPSAAPSCHGLIGEEGRCLPDCLPAVAAQREDLVQDSCANGRSCVPCFDPVSGDSTGACTRAGDMPREEKRTFAACCGGASRCIPSSRVTGDDREKLGRDSCTEGDSVCVPNDWVNDAQARPGSCRAPGDIEGRCLLDCLPAVSARRDSLRRTSCAANELCVPCYDPLEGTSSGACELRGDGPAEGPRLYPSCCGQAGTCVPNELLPDASSATADTCSAGSSCVPDAAANGGDPGFAPCSSLLGRGACVPTCFIAPLQRLLLTADGCAAGAELCAPCSSIGSGTAACR